MNKTTQCLDILLVKVLTPSLFDVVVEGVKFFCPISFEVEKF